MKFIIPVLILALSGCAAMQVDFEAQNCNYNGAYEKGVNDAQEGRRSNSGALASQCPEKTRAEVGKGYLAGYTGAKGRPTININLNARSTKSCQAREGQDAHQSFCEGLSRSSCGVHSVCIWR